MIRSVWLSQSTASLWPVSQVVGTTHAAERADVPVERAAPALLRPLVGGVLHRQCWRPLCNQGTRMLGGTDMCGRCFDTDIVSRQLSSLCVRQGGLGIERESTNNYRLKERVHLPPENSYQVFQVASDSPTKVLLALDRKQPFRFVSQGYLDTAYWLNVSWRRSLILFVFSI